MKALLPSVFLLLLAILDSGCVTKTRARLQAEEAFLAGQRQALAQQQAQNQEPQVYFRGQFRNRSIPWVEGMTLAQAILEAQFLANWEPYEIILSRQGAVQRVKTKRMLSGLQNPLLEPGDQIEINR
jgi:hypothetical protein